MDKLKLEGAGGWDSNVYSNPEKHNLEILLSEDIAGSYEFNMLVVWKDKQGRLWYDTDSGCSCPSPFENTHELDRVWSLDTLREATGDDYSRFMDAENERVVTAALEALRGGSTAPLTRLEQIKKEMGF